MTYEIVCPFCGEKIVSDVVDSMNGVDGEWQCNNGHTFSLMYHGTIKEK